MISLHQENGAEEEPAHQSHAIGFNCAVSHERRHTTTLSNSELAVQLLLGSRNSEEEDRHLK